MDKSAADIVKKIKSDYGKLVARSGSDGFADVSRLPSGILAFDIATGGGFPMGKVSVVYGPESSGKCHAAGDRIMMFTGKSKAVEDIKVGDVLMGVDSTPRVVTGIGRGHGELYKITPIKGRGSFTVNGDHQLHLVCTHDQGYSYVGQKVQISVNDYLAKSNDWKVYHHLYRVGVDFPESELPIDPYFLGLWLGDGSSTSMQVYSVREEIIDWLQEYADSLGGRLSVYDKDAACAGYAIVGTHLRSAMNDLGLFKNKHIPDIFLRNSRANRLKLLAGLIDTDGAKGSGSSCNFYNTNKELCDQVRWLAQSLGYYASLNYKKATCNGKPFDSWDVYISMDRPSELPLLLEYKRPEKRKRAGSCLTSRFTVEPIGVGDFYGFEVDKDHLYLTEDFIVNHNTNLVYKAIAEGQKIHQDKVAVFVDAEHGYDPAWASSLGVDTERLVVISPEYAEQAVDIIESFLYASDVFCIVLDSIAALSTQNEINNSAEKASVGGASLVVGRLLKKATVSFNRMSNQGLTPPAFIAINQIRNKIGDTYNPESMPGGFAVKFAASLIVRMYGKNVMDQKIHPILPVYKETNIILKKWKMPIVAANAVYSIQMIEANGRKPGFIDDWNTMKTYMVEYGFLVKKSPTCWIFLGEEFKTLTSIKELLYSNHDLLVKVRGQIIKSCLSASLTPPSPDEEQIQDE